jgi:uncharacterized RmlC-like cupin family protein
MSDSCSARGRDGLRIVRSAPRHPDIISECGVESEMLLQSQSLFLKRESIGPRATGIRHLHTTASIIIVLSGRVRVNYGHVFEHVDYAEPGDFILIPAMMPHQPVNESGEDIVVCLVVRDAPVDDLIPYTEHPSIAA